MENEDKKIIQEIFLKVKTKHKLKCNLENIKEIEDYKIKVTIDISEEEYNNCSAILFDMLANIEYLFAEDPFEYTNGKLIIIYAASSRCINITRKDAGLPQRPIF